MPGLIEGAHEGHGLGHQFLRHIERTKVLVHLVDVSGASGRDPVEDFDTIRRELELYNPELLKKPQLVAANKIDAVDDPKRVTALEKRAKKLKLPFFQISAVTGDGVKELVEAAWPIIAKARDAEAAAHRRSTRTRGRRGARGAGGLQPGAGAAAAQRQHARTRRR